MLAMGLDREGILPRPRPGHHAALLIHHLVRHDGLHVRSLVDLAVLWPALDAGEGHAFAALARYLGVGRAAASLGAAFRSELALSVPPGFAERAGAWSVETLVALACDSEDHDLEAMTRSRARRRIRVVDRPLRTAAHFMTEALFPPDVYLSWRWPGRSWIGRRATHLGRLARKAAP